MTHIGRDTSLISQKFPMHSLADKLYERKLWPCFCQNVFYFMTHSPAFDLNLFDSFLEKNKASYPDHPVCFENISSYATGFSNNSAFAVSRPKGLPMYVSSAFYRVFSRKSNNFTCNDKLPGRDVHDVFLVLTESLRPRPRPRSRSRPRPGQTCPRPYVVPWHSPAWPSSSMKPWKGKVTAVKT